MTSDEWRALQPYLLEALEIPPSERETMLLRLRQTEPDVASNLTHLLEANASISFRPEAFFRFSGTSETTHVTFAPGAVVAERFRIVRHIGRGGMGDVYEADDRELGRVALKTIRPDIAARPGMAAAFRREVQLARRISSPHVCRIHELLFSTAPDGKPGPAFLTMQYVDGLTLSDHLAQNGPIKPKQATEIAQQLCEGLSAIHRAGVIHADLKSRNIMLESRNGQYRAVIMDFGLAREAQFAAAAAAAGSAETVSGVSSDSFIGTPEYMAPEQFEGGRITTATDIYSLGVVLYEMITGTRPFEAPHALATASKRGRKPESPTSVRPGLPHRWNSVIDGCLQYHPAKRYQSAEDVWRALSAPVLSSVSRTVKNRPGRALGAMAAAAIVAAAGFVWMLEHRYRPPSPSAQRWFQEGVASLREGTYLKASRQLGEAVKSDDGFALAHARLADAWNELDREGEAKDELIKASAPDRTKNLPQVDALYLEAIRATVLHDAAHAIGTYQQILTRLPKPDKARGYVDLGRAYEKSGELYHAMDSYQRAVALDPEYAAAYVRLGVLEGRQNKLKEADQALGRAEALYRTGSNAEGLAEIAFQRGYIADLSSQLGKAEKYLEDALQIARYLDSPEFQMRILSRLAITQYLGGHDKQAIADANQEMSLAQSNSVPYWETDAMIRKAATYSSDASQLATADSEASEAIATAHRNGWSALEANATFTLAAIREQQQRPQEEFELASHAFNYFKKAGYFTDSTRSMLLMIRAKLARGDCQDAARLSGDALKSAAAAGNPSLTMQVEEAVANVSLQTQQFPDAIEHFRRAADLARETQSAYLSYELANEAMALAQAGRGLDAKSFAKSIPPSGDPALRAFLLREEVTDALGTGRFEQARRGCMELMKTSPDVKSEAEAKAALASYYLHDSRSALQFANAAVNDAAGSPDPGTLAYAKLALAAAYLANGSFTAAIPVASEALDQFAKATETENQLLTLSILRSATKHAGTGAEAEDYSRRISGLLSDLKQKWGESAFKQYADRADLRVIISEQ